MGKPHLKIRAVLPLHKYVCTYTTYSVHILTNKALATYLPTESAMRKDWQLYSNAGRQSRNVAKFTTRSLAPPIQCKCLSPCLLVSLPSTPSVGRRLHRADRGRFPSHKSQHYYHVHYNVILPLFQHPTMCVRASRSSSVPVFFPQTLSYCNRLLALQASFSSHYGSLQLSPQGPAQLPESLPLAGDGLWKRPAEAQRKQSLSQTSPLSTWTHAA